MWREKVSFIWQSWRTTPSIMESSSDAVVAGFFRRQLRLPEVRTLWRPAKRTNCTSAVATMDLTKFGLVFTIRCLELAPKSETSTDWLIDWLIGEVCCSNWSDFACVDSLIDSSVAIILEVLKWMAASVIPRIKSVFFPLSIGGLACESFSIMNFYFLFF